MRVADDGEQSVKHEGDDRGASADTADERDRDQEAEERQAGNRLEDVSEPEHRWAEARPSRQQDPQRHTDGYGDEGGGPH